MSAAVVNSPVFSPSRTPSALTCMSSPETASLAMLEGSPSSTFRPRLQQRLRTFRPVHETSPSTNLLKRKRPARIEIPVAMEAAVFAPPPESDGRGEVEEEGERFSVFCKKGRKRLAMEDRYAASSHLLGDPHSEFFGIFDGHGGPQAAEFASLNLANNIENQLSEDALRLAYLKTDAEFLSKRELRGGACVVTAVITNRTLIVSNAGDCRAVLCRTGIAEALTSDHRPSRIDEKDRIESLGGFVERRGVGGVWRLQGRLSVSRGIGDSYLKKWVTAEPETKTIKLTNDHEFLILASDGLWDKVSNQEAVDVVSRCSSMDSEKKLSLLSACKKLAELSTMRGSMDDISVMVITLKDFVKN